MQKPYDAQWTIIDLINWTTAYFNSHQIDSPRLTVELLLAHLLGVDRLDLYLRHDQPLLPGELERFKQLIKRRLHREPVAYIIGRKDFWEMTFAVNPNVLIPRPETEFLIEAALEWLPAAPHNRRLRILELGTGSGAIIISLAGGRPGHGYYASDKNIGALSLARQNAAANSLLDHIQFFGASWLAPIKPGVGFDLIVSNPPYIPREEILRLAPEIGRYEPQSALDGGPDGLSKIRRIIADAPGYLSPGGCLLLEIGSGQGETVASLLESTREMHLDRVIKDYGGHDRVVMARRHA